MKILKIKGGETILDDDDYEWASQFRWRVNEWGYAVKSHASTSGRLTMIRLSRVIMNAPPYMEVDHINRIPLDNRKENLRLATKQQNAWNRLIARKDKKEPKGVGWHKRIQKYQTRIRVNGGYEHLGYFDSVEEAKAVFEIRASQLRGDWHPSK
jgi:HNH endonuclease